MEKCNYKNCDKEATTYGHVFTKEDATVLVHACDEHKKLPSFFEAKTKE